MIDITVESDVLTKRTRTFDNEHDAQTHLNVYGYVRPLHDGIPGPGLSAPVPAAAKTTWKVRHQREPYHPITVTVERY